MDDMKEDDFWLHPSNGRWMDRDPIYGKLTSQENGAEKNQKFWKTTGVPAPHAATSSAHLLPWLGLGRVEFAMIPSFAATYDENLWCGKFMTSCEGRSVCIIIYNICELDAYKFI